jgi:hypothetical protein
MPLMRPDERALLQRIADGETGFSYPSEELVQTLRTLEALGYVSDVAALRDFQGGGGWYTATSQITEAGKEALEEK